MISRNFYEDGPDLMHPRIDMDGAKSGIIGSEFPFFNYGIFLIAKIFGYSHWYGRLLNLIISSIGIYFFYKIIRKYFNSATAFNATFVLLVSIWFAFSRKIMPDTFSLSLVLIGLFYVAEYFENKSFGNLFLYVLLSGLGVLCKIPALFLLSFLVIPLLHPGIRTDRKLIAGLATCLLLVPVYLWYFYYIPRLISNNGFQLFFPKTIFEGVSEIIPLIPQLLEKFYFSAFSSYLAFVCFFVGIILVVRTANKWFCLGLISAFVVFFIFILKTGAVFPLHNYYVIPFVPVMALVAGIGIASVKSNWQILLLLFIAMEGISNQQHDFFIKESEKYKLSLETIMDTFVGKQERIVLVGGLSPQQLYLSHRKGWIFAPGSLPNRDEMSKLVEQGAAFLVIDKNLYQRATISYATIYDGDNYTIHRLLPTTTLKGMFK